MTQVLHCDPSSIVFSPSSDKPQISSPETLESLRAASRCILRQQPVAFPTETVYGLGALALDTAAASRIFSTKGRPPDNPLIVHVSSFSMLQSLLPQSYTFSKAYDVLIKRFWPGALTLLFPSDPSTIPSIITAGHPTVAIRMPSHPVARALIALTDAPIAAPSANSSGKPSPTRAEHVFNDLENKIEIILDGGACRGGLESTVVDGLNEDGDIRILRPGGVNVEEIERALREELHAPNTRPRVLVHKRDYQDAALEQAPTTPGMKYRHYSPSAPVTLLFLTPPPEDVEPICFASFLSSWEGKKGPLKTKIGLMIPSDSHLAKYKFPTEAFDWRLYLLGSTQDPSATAHLLFDGFLTLEREGVDLILIEAISEEREGLAVMNRVKKAAGEVRWISFN